MVSVLFSFRPFVSGLYFHTLGVCYFWFSCARVSSANWYTPWFGFIYTFVRVSRSNFTFVRWDVQDMLVEVHLIVDKAWDLARIRSISGDILPEAWSLYGEYKCSALNCSFDDSHRRWKWFHDSRLNSAWISLLAPLNKVPREVFRRWLPHWSLIFINVSEC